MRGSAPASSPLTIICPLCEVVELGPSGGVSARCNSCSRAVEDAILTLKQIATLPSALGKHACEECGHPEMRCCPTGCSTAPLVARRSSPSKPALLASVCISNS